MVGKEAVLAHGYVFAEAIPKLFVIEWDVRRWLVSIYLRYRHTTSQHSRVSHHMKREDCSSTRLQGEHIDSVELCVLIILGEE